ncbi:hypothetical protein ACGC1H_003841 [Rhizoctonia solani]
MKYAGYFLTMGPDGGIFNWLWFMSAIQNRSEITVEQYDNENIEQRTLNVDSMVDMIMNVLVRLAKAAIQPGDKEAMATKVKTTFTNLSHWEAEGGFLDFYHESSDSNSSYTYRVAFAFPHESSITDFYTVIATIRLTADIHEKSTWWGLDHSSTRKFGANITCIKLKCTKNFVAGEKPPFVGWWFGSIIAQMYVGGMCSI